MSFSVPSMGTVTSPDSVDLSKPFSVELLVKMSPSACDQGSKVGVLQRLHRAFQGRMPDSPINERTVATYLETCRWSIDVLLGLDEPRQR